MTKMDFFKKKKWNRNLSGAPRDLMVKWSSANATRSPIYIVERDYLT